MKIQKITHGFVIQTFDTDSQTWTEQEFVAGDDCSYEVNGDPINVEDFLDRVVDSKEPYLPFHMVQPTEMKE